MRWWLGLALAFFLSPLAALEGPPMEISELARRAQLIVRGKVQEITVQRDPSGRIFSEIKLTVNEAWKGDPNAPLLKVIRSGGTLGEHRDFAVGDVSYDVNEEVVIFLVRNVRGEAVTLGISDGKFRINKDDATNGRRRLTLKDLKDQVREAIR